MSASAVQTEIIEPMQRMFSPPMRLGDDEGEQVKALRDYVGALQHYDAPDLKAAWVEVVGTHAKTTWPLPAIFAKAAREARKDNPDAVRSDRKPPWWRPSETEKRLMWDAAVSSPQAREAVKLKVAWSFKCAVLNDGTPHDKVDLPALRRGVDSAEATADRIMAGEPHHWKGRTFTMSDENAKIAMRMWAVLGTRESETQAEIRAAHAKLHQPA